MKSVHSDAPPARRQGPDVCGNVLGNGQAVADGSGRLGAGVLAGAGTSDGIPFGTWAAASAAPCHRQAATATTITSAWRHGCRARSLLTARTIHQETVI